MGSTLTNEQAYSLVGGFVGGLMVGILMVLFAVYVVCVIALWKIFTKAGEAGWKALIPIYNAYILCKIIGVNFWTYVIIIPIALGFVCGIAFGDKSQTTNMITSLYTLFIEIYTSIKLAKAFGKGTGFTVGLVLLAPIFYLILAFGNAEYVGIEEK